MIFFLPQENPTKNEREATKLLNHIMTEAPAYKSKLKTKDPNQLMIRAINTDVFFSKIEKLNMNHFYAYSTTKKENVKIFKGTILTSTGLQLKEDTFKNNYSSASPLIKAFLDSKIKSLQTQKPTKPEREVGTKRKQDKKL